ncbi:hypothetical protein, variant [Sphaeroforma arctica JP610]|nr:hypothetical protein, variant [Sphaeroforma arctica JP610]KNC78262.1 hypothetical protein, variant [Sphaeroforma arctica JP610]|eukprot:XP_014152164.1 hypothetical protein, variant [Sphaeroforma arctica JP610]
MKRGTRRYARRQLTWLRGHFANYIKLPANTWAVNTTGAEKGVREHQAGELIAPGVAEECGDPLSTVSGDNSVNTTERPLENAGNRAAPWTVVHNGTVIEKGTGLGKKGPGFKDTNLGHTDEKLENGHGSESTKPDVLSSDTIQSVPVAVRHIPIESSTTTGVCAVHLNVASEPEMNVYVIDSTNTTEYTRTVLPRAMALVNMFLSEDKGRMMPHVDVERDLPEDIRESLKKASTRIADKKKRYCDTCDISVLGDDVWMSHTKGKRHKALNKRLKQNADVMSDKSETTIKS